MQLLLVRHLWGMVGSPVELFPRIKKQGYAAIESVLPDVQEQERFSDLLQEHDLQYIPQVLTQGKTVEEHLTSFRQQIERAQRFGPKMINCHSGRDSWSLEQAFSFFGQALAIEAQMGVSVAHETHRSRILFHPVITHQMLKRFEKLQLCCDLSHWVCVCERLLDDQLETIQLCAERCIHLHARVGHEQGPQVSDPRAPEFARHLEAHESWWDMIWDAQERRGIQESTVTPEFGPPGYLQVLPYTQAPVADLEDICNWQAQRQATRFARRSSASKQD